MIARLKRIVGLSIPIILILWFPYRFYTEITHYYTHYDGQLIGYILGYAGSAGCIAGIVFANRRRRKIVAVLYGMALVSCIFFCYWITRIPFCTMCEPIDRSELGFMLEPFADRFFGP